MKRCSPTGYPQGINPNDTQLFSAFDRLPIEDQLIIVLVEVEGFNFQEASDILSLPVDRVVEGLRRARTRLETILNMVTRNDDLPLGREVLHSRWNSDVGHRLKKAIGSIPLSPSLDASILARIRPESMSPSADQPERNESMSGLAEKLVVSS